MDSHILRQESYSFPIKLDSSSIGLNVDLREYFQLRIINSDTTSLIVPEIGMIRQIGNDVLRIPDNANGQQPTEILPLNFVRTVFSYFAIPVTAVYLIENAGDRNRIKNINLFKYLL